MKGLWIFLIGISINLNAQDDLLNMIDESEPTTYTKSTFKGTRIINFQSTEISGHGDLQFMILHRFGAINDDYLYNFFGLDIAQIRFSLDYSFTDWLNVGIGRSSATKTYDGWIKAKILNQSKGEKTMPVSLLWYSSMNYTTLDYNDGYDYSFTDRLSYAHQLVVARKITQSLSLEIIPSLVHFNLVEDEFTPNDIAILGFGGRIKVSKRVALTAEYGLQLNDNFYYDVDGSKKSFDNSFSIGVDVETGGHVFQFHATNSRGLSDPQWMARTPGSWSNGDVYLGFNISRAFTLKKSKTPQD